MLTAAAQCRKNGWTVGTRLEGTEGKGTDWEETSVIEITAVGKQSILARLVTTNGAPDWTPDSEWDLDCRKWRRVR